MATVNPYATPGAELRSEQHDAGVDASSIFSPRERFGRITYVFWNIAFTLALALIALIVIAVGGGGLSSFQGGPEAVLPNLAVGSLILLGIMMLAWLPIGFIFTIRRLHDMNWSGWLSLLMVVPIVSMVLYLLLILLKGTEGANQYGPPARPWSMLQAIVAVPFIVLTVLGVISYVVMAVIGGLL